MDEIEILRTVYAVRKPNWGGQQRYLFKQFRTDLGVSDSRSLSDTLISEILNKKGTPNDDRIRRHLSGPKPRQAGVRATIEGKLGLEGLFNCKTRSEVIALIAERDGTAAALSAANFTILDPASKTDFGLCQTEKLAIKCIVDELFRSQPLVHLATSFDTGASVLAWNLLQDPRCVNHFSRLIFLRPSGPEMDLEPEMARLRQHLDAPELDVVTTQSLLDTVVSERVLIIIFSPYTIDAQLDTNSLKKLIRECEAQRPGWKGPANILIVGQSEWITEKTKNQGQHITQVVTDACLVRDDRRFQEFRAQWERFTRLRKPARAEESGSRMRRAATYYQNQARPKLWPISIKLRALFASNTETYSYFDPTQGFNRLAGPHYTEFDDVVSYYSDVRDYIAYVQHAGHAKRGKLANQGSYFYLLQYVSTAKYWLTEEMLDVLIDKVEPDRPNPLQLKTEMNRIRDFDPVIKPASQSETQIRYVTSLPVKAIVQDNWMETEPYARAVAHHRIAARLKDNEHNKDQLDREFPYEPHWGRSRMYFVAETIRHLMRSCEKAKHEPDLAYEPTIDKLPAVPKAGLNGTDPGEVVNYCYGMLYQRELNGNKNGRNTRALAKKYGAYQLAAELLELMSGGQHLGTVHDALQKSKHNEFVRECGFALLDLGELERANACFDSIETAIDDNSPMDDVINALLDKSMVVGTLGNLDAAKRYIQRADDEIMKRHAQSVEAKPSSKVYLKLRKHYRRFLARKAHIEYLSGNDEAAFDLLVRIESEAKWQQLKSGDTYPREHLVPSFAQRLEAEQEHLFVALLCKRLKNGVVSGEPADLTLALNRCVKALLRAQSAGVHHEAMGFRILLSRIFRRMGKLSTAEVILDEVHRDVLMYGCSERTFLAFLNEAGRVLFGLGDTTRAYATYIRPSLVRSIARGFHREAEQAATLARNVLRDMQGRLGSTDLSGRSWDEQTKLALNKHTDLMAQMNALFEGAPIERDPLFAYSVADAAEIIRRIATGDGISAEVEFVTNEYNAFSNPRTWS